MIPPSLTIRSAYPKAKRVNLNTQAVLKEAPRSIDTTIRKLHPSTAIEVREQKTPRNQARSLVVEKSRASSLAHGLSKNHLAGVPGLEPRTTEPESAVLAITPHPTVASASPP